MPHPVYIARNVMPAMKISTKCMCFSTCVRIRILPITSAKNPQNHPHFTRLKIHRSAFYGRPN